MQYKIGQDPANGGLQLQHGESLSYTVPGSCTERQIGERMPVLGVLWKEAIRIEFFWIGINLGVVVDVVDLQQHDRVLGDDVATPCNNFLSRFPRDHVDAGVQPEHLFDCPLQVLHLLEVVVGGPLVHISQHRFYLFDYLVLKKRVIIWLLQEVPLLGRCGCKL
jgi:hypothetical protein